MGAAKAAATKSEVLKSFMAIIEIVIVDKISLYLKNGKQQQKVKQPDKLKQFLPFCEAWKTLLFLLPFSSVNHIRLIRDMRHPNPDLQA